MDNQPPAVPGKTNDSLSIASLVLGILSMILCSIFTGIPAVITGHMALGRTKRSPAEHGGKGLAIAGLVMGYASIAMLIVMVPLIAALVLPAMAKAKSHASRVSCVNHMKLIGLAARMYANDHNDKWPANFQVMSNELNSTKILICPSDRTKQPANDWASLTEANVTYQFLITPDSDPSKPQAPIFRCPIDGNTTMSDGSVMQGAPSAKSR